MHWTQTGLRKLCALRTACSTGTGYVKKKRWVRGQRPKTKKRPGRFFFLKLKTAFLNSPHRETPKNVVNTEKTPAFGFLEIFLVNTFRESLFCKTFSFLFCVHFGAFLDNKRQVTRGVKKHPVQIGKNPVRVFSSVFLFYRVFAFLGEDCPKSKNTTQHPLQKIHFEFAFQKKSKAN
jgi:hypothetical protein